MFERPHFASRRHLARRLRRRQHPERHRDDHIFFLRRGDRSAPRGSRDALMRGDAIRYSEHGASEHRTDTLVHVQSLPRNAIGEPCPRPALASGAGRSPLPKSFRFTHLASVSFGLLAALATAMCSQHDPKPIDVSVRDVVIDPYAVDGKLVRLIGVLHRTAEGDALYWHEQDIRQSNRHHAVAIRRSSSWLDKAAQPGTHVAVEGIFEADDDRAGSGFNGALLEPRNAEVR